MKPLPTTDSAWLKETRLAFADASEALPIMELLGDKADAAAIVTIAPNLCAKYRGLPPSGREFDRAKKMTLTSYVANADNHAEAFAYPEIAFAFCYVVSHLGFGLISEEETARILDYFIDHTKQLLTPVDAPAAKSKSRGPALATSALDELHRLTADFCTLHLNEEYLELCAKLIRKAGKKRTPPFASGRIESWAAGVVHAICTINFAFDKGQTPHVTAPCIAEHFGVSLNTSSQKSKTLRDLFRMRHWDDNFSTREMQLRRPMILMRGR